MRKLREEAKKGVNKDKDYFKQATTFTKSNNASIKKNQWCF